MEIWKSEISLKGLNQRNEQSMSEHLGICFTEIGSDYVIAKMAVDRKVLQPNGIMNGGASCALAETVASTASNYCIEQSKICVGQSIFTTHLRPIKNGYVFAKALPIHIGRKTHVWQIDIRDANDNLISKSQLTLLVIDKNQI